MTIRRISPTGPDSWPLPKIEIWDGPLDPGSEAAYHAVGRNWDWLGEHWGDFLPAARGRHLVVANQQGTIVESVAEAQVWLAANHPDDPGPIIHYVLPDDGPRF